MLPNSRSEPVLRFDGLVNARDLGGRRIAGGGRTPHGVFFRSENVDLLSDAGWAQAADAGIRTVVDLRQPVERDRDRNERPGWVTSLAVDLDGLDNQAFWKDYWDNGLCGTALYFLPHLLAMPERAVAALSALVTAPPGGVLFHCASGRDRTGMIAMLLLAAADVEPDDVVDDYLETARRGDLRAARTGKVDDEPQLEGLCRSHGTSTEDAFRGALRGLDLDGVLKGGAMTASDRRLLMTWRGALPRKGQPRDAALLRIRQNGWPAGSSMTT